MVKLDIQSRSSKEPKLHTAVALIIFNRPDATERVFAEIARAKPRKLFVVADGPREGNQEDEERCKAARAIVERVDWECEVFRNYSDVNLGCGRRPASGISWVLERVEEAIILEDDCVPHPSFFRFCSELLERYRDNERVMMIGGRTGLPVDSTLLTELEDSYAFRRDPSCWGWATWRRAWQHYDFEMTKWPELRKSSWLMDTLEHEELKEHWFNLFDRAYTKVATADFWDYQWTFGIWAQDGITVSPGVNLVENIGFGIDATHTRKVDDFRSAIRTAEMTFPLRHPPLVEPNTAWDQENLKFKLGRSKSSNKSKKRNLRWLIGFLRG